MSNDYTMKKIEGKCVLVINKQPGQDSISYEQINKAMKEQYGIDMLESATGQYKIKNFYGANNNVEGVEVYRILPSVEIRLEDPGNVNGRRIYQDIIDRYYGNRKKEHEYQESYRRFVKHITKKHLKDEPQKSYKTVRYYAERKQDERTLHLEDYKYRLERYTKSLTMGDGEYEKAALAYVNRLLEDYSNLDSIPDEDKRHRISVEYNQYSINKDSFTKGIIDALKSNDEEYIRTKNGAYNRYETTTKSLKTLGRYGEKVPYLPLQKADNVKSFFGNILKSIMNASIFIRNNTTARINRVIGEKIVAPKYEDIHNPKRDSKGTYSGAISHRFEARRELFAAKYLAEIEMQNKKIKNPKKRVMPSLIRLATEPTFKALFRYREGNAEVINNSISIAESIISSEQKTIKHIASLLNAKKDLNDKIEQLKIFLECSQTRQEINEYNALLNTAKNNCVQIDRMLSDTHLESIIPLDAISPEEHEKANKQNTTIVVSGIKNLIVASAIRLIGPRIKEWFKSKYTEKVLVVAEQSEGVETVKQYISVPKRVIDRNSVEKLTFGDIYSLAQKEGNVISSHVGGTGLETFKPDSIIQGVAVKTSNGEFVSATASKASRAIEQTDYIISELKPSDRILEKIAEILAQKGDPLNTSEKLLDFICNSENPEETLQNYLSSINLQCAKRTGMDPYGWLPLGTGTEKVMDKLINEVAEQIEVQVEVAPQVAPQPKYESVLDVEKYNEAIQKWNSLLSNISSLPQISSVYELIRRSGGIKSSIINDSLRTDYGITGRAKQDKRIFSSTQEEGEKEDEEQFFEFDR